MSRRPVSVVGLHGGTWYGDAAGAALRSADVLVGSTRQHTDLAEADLPGERVELCGSIDEIVELCLERSGAGQEVAVLAAGDPGFFGILRVLSARLGAAHLSVHPAPSSISLAFARVGVPWDDAVVGTCHGRPVDDAVAAVLAHHKVAVLVSADDPPELVGKAVLAAAPAGFERDVWVCSHLGAPEERVNRTDLVGLAAGRFPGLSVVVLIAPGAGVAAARASKWGGDETTFAHRAGLVTKAEVRAIVLGKLDLPASGVLWDVGAGSGSVGIEAARLAPALRVFAVERDPAACHQIRANARGTVVSVTEGAAPGVLATLPDPDRAFVGGGGIDVLDAVRARVRPGGSVVATFATMGPALAAAGRLGSMVQVQVSRATPIGAAGELRLAAENPVFVAWGAGRT